MGKSEDDQQQGLNSASCACALQQKARFCPLSLRLLAQKIQSVTLRSLLLSQRLLVPRHPSALRALPCSWQVAQQVLHGQQRTMRVEVNMMQTWLNCCRLLTPFSHTSSHLFPCTTSPNDLPPLRPPLMLVLINSATPIPILFLLSCQTFSCREDVSWVRGDGVAQCMLIQPCELIPASPTPIPSCPFIHNPQPFIPASCPLIPPASYPPIADYCIFARYYSYVTQCQMGRTASYVGLAATGVLGVSCTGGVGFWVAGAMLGSKEKGEKDEKVPPNAQFCPKFHEKEETGCCGCQMGVI